MQAFPAPPAFGGSLSNGTPNHPFASLQGDTASFQSVPSGAFMSPGDPGLYGSFKGAPPTAQGQPGLMSQPMQTPMMQAPMMQAPTLVQGPNGQLFQMVPHTEIEMVEVPVEAPAEKKKVEEDVKKEAPVTTTTEEKIVYVEKEVPVEKIVEKIVEVEKIVYVDRPVEVEKIVEKEVIVEKIVEVPEKIIEKEVVVERIVEVEKIVEKIVEVPVEKVVTVEKIVKAGAPPAPPAQPQQPRTLTYSPTTYMGMQLDRDTPQEPYMHVTAMVPGGPANVSGLIDIGDKIKSVEGQDCAGKDASAISNLTAGTVGRPCKMTLLRNDEEVPVNIMRTPLGMAPVVPPGGLGIELVKPSPQDKCFTIAQVVPGGAAHASGNVKEGDLLVAAGTTSLENKELQEVRRLISGPAGSTTKLMLKRGAGATGEMVEADIVHQEVRQAPPPPLVVPPGGLGIELKKESPQDTYFTILKVVPGGAAHASGNVKEGDLLVAAGGTPLENKDLNEVRRLISGPTGSTSKLTLQRGNEKMEVDMVHKDVIPPGGLGIELFKQTAQDTYFAILKVVPGSAAHASGNVKEGDLLVAAGGTPLVNKDLNEVRRLISGPTGSTTKLTLQRGAGASAATVEADIVHRDPTSEVTEPIPEPPAIPDPAPLMDLQDSAPVPDASPAPPALPAPVSGAGVGFGVSGSSTPPIVTATTGFTAAAPQQ